MILPWLVIFGLVELDEPARPGTPVVYVCNWRVPLLAFVSSQCFAEEEVLMSSHWRLNCHPSTTVQADNENEKKIVKNLSIQYNFCTLRLKIIKNFSNFELKSHMRN
jgi:hypothetical protein